MNGCEGSRAQTCNTVTERECTGGWHTHADGGKWGVPFTESSDNGLQNHVPVPAFQGLLVPRGVLGTNVCEGWSSASPPTNSLLLSWGRVLTLTCLLHQSYLVMGNGVQSLA